MAEGNYYGSWLVVFLTSLSLVSATIEEVSSATRVGESSSAAFFIFGDSTVDPGNNNYIDTIPENQANYKPYGQNGFFQHPTGRFSNGRIIVDFIADYAKLPPIPPFLQSSDGYINGVNFASGGAGILSQTNEGLAINLRTQLKHFEEVVTSLTQTLGDVQAKELVSEAVYFISIGSNDYMGGYLSNPLMQELYNPEEYVGMVIGNLTQTIQQVYTKGGRKFAFLSLSPLGCLPALRALNAPPNGQGGCLEAASALASAHNNALKAVLASLEHMLKDFKYCNSDFYDWLEERIKNPSNYGFKEGVEACCGTGPYRGIFSCGGRKKVKEYELCDTPEDYVWWDSFHPTERIHQQFAMALWAWDETPSHVGPYDLETLFHFHLYRTIADMVDVDVDDHPQNQTQIF